MNETYSYLLKDARKSLEESRLSSALSALRGVATGLKVWNVAEECKSLEESYTMLLNYLEKGCEDPARVKMYRKFTERAYELCEELKRLWNLEKNDSFYATTFHTLQKLKGKDFTLAELLEEREKEARTLFDATWTSPLLGGAEEKAVNSFMADDSVLHEHKCLLLGALTLSALQFFDEAKIRILMDQALSPDVEIRVRALSGFAFTMVAHDKRIARHEQVRGRLRMMMELPAFVKELEILQQQLFLTLETKRIEKNLQEKIFPEVMKKLKDVRLDQTIGLDEIAAIPLEEEFNPDWKKDKEQKKIEKYIKQLADLQERGADMFMGSFRTLKQRFPFFAVAANWFYPFTLNHPDFPQGSEENSLMRLFAGHAGLCDSDKYSFCLMFQLMPPQSREMMRQNLAQFIEQMNVSQNDLQSFDEKQGFKAALRSYVQGFYRFCNLYIHRKDFPNPFQQNLFLPDCTAFEELLEDDDRLLRLADFAFQDGAYPLAQKLYKKVKPDQLSAEILQKWGFACEKTNQLANASTYYEAACLMKDNSAWTLQRLGTCALRLGEYEQALHSFTKLEEIRPEDTQVALHTAECFIHLEEYEEAFKRLFKVDYLAPDSGTATRALAWCSLLTGKYEQAERFYVKVLGGKPTPTDFLNAGHAAWLLGNLPLAIERYRKSITDPSEASKFLDEDAPILLKAGRSPEELAMMVDAVLKA